MSFTAFRIAGIVPHECDAAASRHHNLLSTLSRANLADLIPEVDSLKWILGFMIVSIAPMVAGAQTAGSSGSESGECQGGGDPHEPVRELSRAGAEEGGPRSEPAGDGPEGRQERGGDRAGVARREPAGRQGGRRRDAAQGGARDGASRGGARLGRGGGPLCQRAAGRAPRRARLVVAAADRARW